MHPLEPACFLVKQGPAAYRQREALDETVKSGHMVPKLKQGIRVMLSKRVANLGCRRDAPREH